ncbi:imelysin family protein [Stappia indica]|uniref:imelysin family protein n=1 Tax=Stappia indica TaxID=538381 RepID=UPI001CD6E77C|nr:imelysin family protein [Stappia indica]MCA1299102.1 imelysin family protein [Stappia indica]
MTGVITRVRTWARAASAAAVLVGLASVLAPAPGLAQEPAIDYGRFVPALVRDYALPAARDLRDRLQELESGVARLCARVDGAGDPGEAATVFADGFAAVVDAHGWLAVSRFGALADASALERLAFVPDARGVVRRQVTRLLAKEDPSALSAATLKDKSVALQGLTALEWIAFSPDGAVVLGTNQPDRAYRCAYAGALVTGLIATANEVESGYATPSGQTALLLSPGLDNRLAATPKEAAEVAFKALMTGLALMKDQVLERVLEPGPANARAARAPFARSHNALRHLSAGIEGLALAITAAGYPEGTKDARWIGNSLRFETANARAALAAVPADLGAGLADPEARARLVYVNTILSGLRGMLGGELAGHLALKGGFNALDGD